MPENPPVNCNPACQKIILNGDSLEHQGSVTCDLLKRLRDEGIRFKDPARVEHAIIEAQKAVFHVQRVIMDEIGYTGELAPWQV